MDEHWRANALRNVREASRVAADEGVRIGLEFLSLGAPIGPFILDSLELTKCIVEEVSSTAVGINVDFFHHFRSGGIADELSTLQSDQIFAVHVTDAVDRPLEQLTDGDRVLPGEGILPMKDYRDAIQATGYKEAWTLELLSEKLWASDVDVVASQSMDAMQRFASG